MISEKKKFKMSKFIGFFNFFLFFTIAVLSKDPVKILSPSALKCKLTISPV